MPPSAEGNVSISGDAETSTNLEDSDVITDAKDRGSDKDSAIFLNSPAESATDVSVRSEEQRPPKLTKIKVRTVTKEYCCGANFMKKVWKAFFTLNLFVIPVLLGLMFGMVLNGGDTTWIDGDYYTEVTHHIMVAFLATAMVVGLPYHLMALDDLEEAVLRAQKDRQVTSKTTTRTTYYYYDTEEEHLEELC